jgi:hypothetical protein
VLKFSLGLIYLPLFVSLFVSITTNNKELSKKEMATYVSFHLHTAWCRILFEKLIVTQLVKKYPVFFWNQKFHYRGHRSPPLDPILSQLNPVFPSIPISLRSILMLSSHLRLGLLSRLLPSGLPTKTL